MIYINFIGILLHYIMFNTFNKQTDNENNNNLIPITHSGFLSFLLIQFFVITIVA